MVDFFLRLELHLITYSQRLGFFSELTFLSLILWPMTYPTFTFHLPLLLYHLDVRRQQAGGANTHTSTIMSARALDDATEAGRIAKVDVKLSKAIAQARTAMKLSQKDLAASINTTPNLIAQYENGSAIPDARIISALERKLSTKLPRPGKSKPPPKDASTSGAKTTQSKATSGGVTRGGPPKRR